MALTGWTAGEETAGPTSVPSSHLSGDAAPSGWVDRAPGGPTGPGVEIDSEASARGRSSFSGGEDEEKISLRKKKNNSCSSVTTRGNHDPNIDLRCNVLVLRSDYFFSFF